MTFHRDRLPDPQSYFESQGLTLQRGGKWRTTECRFHEGSDSMRVNIETGAFCCMASCGAKGGDVLAYQMLAQDQEFIEAAKALGAWEDDARPSRFPQRPLPFRARDALEVLREEALLTTVAAHNLARGVALTNVDRQRLRESARRIITIVEAVTT